MSAYPGTGYHIKVTEVTSEDQAIRARDAVLSALATESNAGQVIIGDPKLGDTLDTGNTVIQKNAYYISVTFPLGQVSDRERARINSIVATTVRDAFVSNY